MFDLRLDIFLNTHLQDKLVPARLVRHDLARQLEALGITRDKQIVTHCQTHHRSGFTYLAAKILGYPRVKAYPGSWSEWGNHPDTPVES